MKYLRSISFISGCKSLLFNVNTNGDCYRSLYSHCISNEKVYFLLFFFTMIYRIYNLSSRKKLSICVINISQRCHVNTINYEYIFLSNVLIYYCLFLGSFPHTLTLINNNVNCIDCIDRVF